MSHPVPATLYRIAAAAGCGSAVVLLINAAKRAEVIATSDFTQLIAPLAQILALAFVTALYLAFGRRSGTFGQAMHVNRKGGSCIGVRTRERMPPTNRVRPGEDLWGESEGNC